MKIQKLSINIPEELIIQVLKEVPVKYLLRFRCVSKQWLSIIDDPFFVTLHRERSHSRPDGVTFRMEFETKGLACLYTPSAPERYCFKFDYYKVDEAEAPEPYCYKFDDKDEAKEETSSVFGFSQPLMCVEGLTLSSKGKIRNHSTRKELWTPPPPPPPHPNIPEFTSIFLGFNPLSKEYKLLYVGRVIKGTDLKNIATIHTLGTSSWTSIDVPIDLHFMGMRAYNATSSWQCCVNGVLYIRCSIHARYSIVPFDLGTEKFRPLMPFPLEITDLDYRCELYDFGGNLLVFIPYAEFCWTLDDQDTVRWKKERVVVKRRYPDLYNLSSIITTFPDVMKPRFDDDSLKSFRSFRHVETLLSTKPRPFQKKAT